MIPQWQSRTAMLVGEEGLSRLADAAVVVVGLGGVGAVAAEMGARAGVGHLTIIDCDTVSDTNRNRQIPALVSTVGLRKTSVVASRLLDINPSLDLNVIDDYLTADNVASLIGSAAAGASCCPAASDSGSAGAGRAVDFVIDAIDTLAPKLALISYCVGAGIPLVSSMGSGAKYDVTKIRIADLSKSFNCPLAYIVRKKLRKMGITKGFDVVFSEELPDEAAIVEMTPEERLSIANKKSQGGTVSYLPAAFGCACAQACLRRLLSR